MALNVTYVEVGIRNRLFLCICSSINIVIVVVVMFQNQQVMVTSLSFCRYSGGAPQLSGVPAIGGAGKTENDRGIAIGDECDLPR